MIFNVSQQLKEPIGSTRHYKIESADPPVSGEVVLFRTDRGIFVNGTLSTVVSTVCSRCLTPFDQRLTLNIEEEFTPVSSASAWGSAFVISANHEIDLREAVRQCSVLALPMKPLCRSDCAGLCPSCGHNLNLGPCDCNRRGDDPRLIGAARSALRSGGEDG